MKKRKICVVTGSRADYGLLYWLMKYINDDYYLQLQIIATGMHLSPEFGLTYKKIEEDGFVIDEKVEMLLSSDTTNGITKSIGLGVIGFADAIDRLQPDVLVILGDRFEVFAASQAALIAKIPIAHIAGGDTTEGAYDEAIRHSITKMGHLHFPTNEVSAKRIIQLGENPQHIFNVGSTGIDYIRQANLLKKADLERTLEFEFKEKNLLVTFHPVTLDTMPTEIQFSELLNALGQLGDDVGIIITKPNADNYGRTLIDMIDSFIHNHANTISFTSMGQINYLSVMSIVDAVVGNSSSGLYEAPSFQKPTINIGKRQQGRLQASSVINCDAISERILVAINKAFSMKCEDVINPYGDGTASKKIYTVLKDFTHLNQLIIKHFYEVGF